MIQHYISHKLVPQSKRLFLLFLVNDDFLVAKLDYIQQLRAILILTDGVDTGAGDQKIPNLLIKLTNYFVSARSSCREDTDPQGVIITDHQDPEADVMKTGVIITVHMMTGGTVPCCPLFPHHRPCHHLT